MPTVNNDADPRHRGHRLCRIAARHRAAWPRATRSSPPRATSIGSPIRLVRRGDAVALDAHDPESARTAFADAGPIDVVYYLVHGIGQPDFRDADNARRGQRRRGGQGRRRAAHRLPRWVRARRRRAVRTPDQPRRGRRGADRRRRPRSGVAGRGDDHRRGVDVVRDAALRRRPVPADSACRRGRTTRWTRSPSATCCTTSSPRPIGAGARRRLRHLRPGDARPTASCWPHTAARPASGGPACRSAAWTPAGVAGDRASCCRCPAGWPPISLSRLIIR